MLSHMVAERQLMDTLEVPQWMWTEQPGKGGHCPSLMLLLHCTAVIRIVAAVAADVVSAFFFFFIVCFLISLSYLAL